MEVEVSIEVSMEVEVSTEVSIEVSMEVRCGARGLRGLSSHDVRRSVFRCLLTPIVVSHSPHNLQPGTLVHASRPHIGSTDMQHQLQTLRLGVSDCVVDEADPQPSAAKHGSNSETGDIHHLALLSLLFMLLSHLVGPVGRHRPQSERNIPRDGSGVSDRDTDRGIGLDTGEVDKLTLTWVEKSENLPFLPALLPKHLRFDGNHSPEVSLGCWSEEGGEGGAGERVCGWWDGRDGGGGERGRTGGV